MTCCYCEDEVKARKKLTMRPPPQTTGNAVHHYYPNSTVSPNPLLVTGMGAFDY
jgi:hypothetical protein